VLAASATALALLAFWICAPYLEGRVDLVVVLTATLLVASSSMIGVLAPYSVELYPTALRGLGSGVVAGSSKSGGIVGPLLVGVLLTLSPGSGLPALIIAIPVALAGMSIGWRGTETRGRSLEQLAALAAARSRKK
jgi:putative MFS transporter